MSRPLPARRPGFASRSQAVSASQPQPICSGLTSGLAPVRRSGFALLLTLMVLALAAVILSLSARRSTTATRSALQAERDLRHKWALAAGETLLEQANVLLVDPAAGDAAHARPLPVRKFDLTMAGERVVILLASEQGKPNINSLAKRLPAFDLARLIETLGGKDPLAGVDADRPFWCLEQLRPGATPSDLLGGPWPDSIHPGLATAATLAGDGKLDWRIASPAALVAVLGPEVPSDKAQALVSANKKPSPRLPWHR